MAEFADQADSRRRPTADAELLRTRARTARMSLPLAGLLLLAILAGCSESESRPPSIPVRTETALERRVTLSSLRRAWEERPEGVSDDHCWYERRLLDRSAFFGRKISNTETYLEACQFWNRCLREHLETYDDDHYKRR